MSSIIISASEFRKDIKKYLNFVATGQVVIVDRFGQRFIISYLPKEIDFIIDINPPKPQPEDGGIDCELCGESLQHCTWVHVAGEKDEYWHHDCYASRKNMARPLKGEKEVD